ncbi:enoyl-CoA hydratase-related protein [Actinomycetospora atypica]|uniref:Enoyl-CoA hydratase-related protein n=1 Tax=Actinomycetospora atypica TaxID=1290095 RepID=A0ABV9YRU2_9PSEU
MTYAVPHDRTAVITIDRPTARGAITPEMATRIEEYWDQIEADDAIWAGVITGTGPVFCAGADLKRMANGGGGPAGTERGGFAGIADRVRTKPLIAAVNGPAVAGGCEIVLAADLVVAVPRASFGLPEVKRSLVAAAGGLYHAPRALPRNLAMEMALTGDPVSAERAYTHGLVNVVAEEDRLVDEALALADRICANAPLAVRESRRVLLQGMTLDEVAARSLATESMSWIRTTEDFTEGPRAFVEKRAPQWTGR